MLLINLIIRESAEEEDACQINAGEFISGLL